MRAVVCQHGQLQLTDIEEVAPGPDQVLVRTLACGICGTDIHARRHLPRFLDQLAAAGAKLPTDPDEAVVFGHEFSAEILEYGPGSERRLSIGTHVVSMPFVTGPVGAEYVGYSNRFPGGFAERMVLTERLLLPVPNGLPPTHAALTEPFAVGTHAVMRGLHGLERMPSAIVVGCGPIGLAVIAGLAAEGVERIVAIDFSERRRALAAGLGAHETVDPAAEELASVCARMNVPSLRPVVFECVGRPGMIQTVIAAVPKRTRVVVVGNCLEPSAIDPAMAFNKELDLIFSVNFSSTEFKQTLRNLAEGRVDGGKCLTDVIGLADVETAFDQLAGASDHGKIMIAFDDA